MIQDLKYGIRMLWRAPVVSGAAILTLALGIGANTAIFSVVEATLLRPLPFPDFERLVQVERLYPEFRSVNVSIPQYTYWRQRTQSFDALAAYDWLDIGFNLTGRGEPVRYSGKRVTANFFEVFGVQPATGRSFTAEEDAPSGPLAVILSDGLWRDSFGGDLEIIGQSLQLNGREHQVVGIMPPDFRYPALARLWVPLQADPTSTDRQAYLQITGKLTAGTTATQAMAEMTAINEGYLDSFGTVTEGEVVDMRSPREMLFGNLQTTFQLVAAITGFVLLIACGNVASLQLARSAERRREIVLRRSLGAPTHRIVRQLITETLLVAMLGGALGVGLGAASLQLTAQLVPAETRPIAAAGMSIPVLAFTTAVSLAVGVFTGLLPAVRIRSLGGPAGLGLVTERSIAGSGSAARHLVVASQVALTVVALVGAGLFIRSFLVLMERDVGFDPYSVMTAHMPMTAERYDGPEDWQDLVDRLLPAIAAQPGVEAVAAATSIPLELAPGMTFVIEGAPPPATDDDVPGAHYRPGSADYFETFGIPIVAGRGFEETDRLDSAGVLVINEETAAQYWPEGDALGAQVTIGPPFFPPPFHDPAPRTVVGIAGNVLEEGLDSDPAAVVYVPLAQVPTGLMQRYVSLMPLALAVRTSGAPEAAVAGLRSAVLDHDPTQPLTSVQTLRTYLRGTVVDRRTTAQLLTAFGALALFLAMIGVYGVAAHAVQRRTREIGLRMALGAGRGAIRWLVLRQSLGAVLIGVALGIAAALALGRYAASLVYGIGTSDPATLIAVPAMLLLVAGAAVLFPVARALRIDPAGALRDA